MSHAFQKVSRISSIPFRLCFSFPSKNEDSIYASRVQNCGGLFPFDLSRFYSVSSCFNPRNPFSGKSSRPVCTKDITPSEKRVSFCLPDSSSSSTSVHPDPPTPVSEPALGPVAIDASVDPLPFGQSLPLLNLSQMSTPPTSSAPVSSSSSGNLLLLIYYCRCCSTSFLLLF